MSSKASGIATLAIASTGGALATLTVFALIGGIVEFVASNSTFFSGLLCGGIFTVVAYSVRKSSKEKNGKN